MPRLRRLSDQELRVLKKRLKAHHITKNTQVFVPEESSNIAAMKLEGYWVAWLEMDISRLFYEIESQRKVLSKSK